MTRLFSIVSTRATVELSTEFVCPPIPFRGFDWSAIDSNTYDADFDYESGCFTSKSPQGTGATEFEAINDLLDQIEEKGA